MIAASLLGVLLVISRSLSVGEPDIERNPTITPRSLTVEQEVLIFYKLERNHIVLRGVFYEVYISDMLI